MNANKSSERHLVYHMSFSPADFALGIKAMIGKTRNKFPNEFSEVTYFSSLDGVEWREVVCTSLLLAGQFLCFRQKKYA